MYQIYGMLGLMVFFWSVAIWASIADEPVKNR